MTKIFLYFLGIVLTTIGLIYIICYMNLISLGYNFTDYVKFICSRPECIMAFIGIVILFLAERRNK